MRSETAEGRRFAQESGTLLDVGVAPDVVAGMVVEAILENRFWILTHPAWGDVMRRRVEAMVTTGELTSRAPD